MTNEGAGRTHCHWLTDAVRRCLLQCITACPLVSSSKTKPCQFSSVQLRRYVRALHRADVTTAICCHCSTIPHSYDDDTMPGTISNLLWKTDKTQNLNRTENVINENEFRETKLLLCET